MVINEDEKRKILLNNIQNKMLTYVAGGLVSLFTLFQILFEVENVSSINPYIILFFSIVFSSGILIFTYVGYLNFKEVIQTENELGLDRIKGHKPSGFFSGIKDNKRYISKKCKTIVIGFFAFTVILFLSIFYYLFF